MKSSVKGTGGNVHHTELRRPVVVCSARQLVNATQPRAPVLNLLPLLALTILLSCAGPSSAPASAPAAQPEQPTQLAQSGQAPQPARSGQSGESLDVEQTDLAWYLPADAQYNADFPTPESVLGWKVGSWHVRHDQLLRWYETVAAESPRVKLETYGYSHEQRPLLLATISSPENLQRIEEIRRAHVQSVLGNDSNYEGPEVVWMGYSVHGNEASASNAALLLAYHLAAAEGKEMEAFLADTVVLIDPCLNPDGLSRFAQWANMHRGQNLVGDPRHREHNEAWPGGRTNHYWFDLNRDWLLLTHPESRARLAKFHQWMPQVLTDFHEMGTESTFFFQPGIPSRTNPMTPPRNIELTRQIATYHTAALDKIGSLYFTEESFDDFYYGKGSTYPDLHGAIGILFEQASARGHFQENSFGGVTFPFAIRNQLTVSLSTLQALHEMRGELASYQRDFFHNAQQEAQDQDLAAYVVSSSGDATRLHEFARILHQHNIKVHRLGKDLTLKNNDNLFAAGDSLVIPLEQAQYRLIRALFEMRTSWDDNTFYDVSSWTLPLAFNLPSAPVSRRQFSTEFIGAEWSPTPTANGKLHQADATVAWIFEWHDYAAPKALQILLEGGARARVSTKPFDCVTSEGTKSFALGSIVVAAGIQELEADDMNQLLQQAAATGVTIHAATKGLTPAGVDLGSRSFRALTEPKPLMLVGSGVSSYEAGEAWHLLDKRFGLALSMVEKSRLGRLDLSRYSHMLLVNGAASGFGEQEIAAIQEWVRDGGVLVASKSSAIWAAKNLLPTAPAKEEEEEKPSEVDEDVAPPAYADYEALNAVDLISGTIFNTRLDLTHPMCFGFTRENLPVFRNSSSVLPMGVDPFAAPVRYTKEPLLSGYASAKRVEEIRLSPAVRAERVGRGTVICLVDNPNFRGVWYGTNKLYANAIYFGGVIKRTGPIDGLEETLKTYELERKR